MRSPRGAGVTLPGLGLATVSACREEIITSWSPDLRSGAGFGRSPVVRNERAGLALTVPSPQPHSPTWRYGYITRWCLDVGNSLDACAVPKIATSVICGFGSRP